MKKFLFTFALFIGVVSMYNTTNAQSVNVSININSQPSWGPVGYDYVGYYYFPDIDCYYNVNSRLYYFYDRGMWVSAQYLPYSYRNYDLYGMYKVVLNVDRPWLYNRTHRRDYARYVNYRPQVVIRDSRDNRYRYSRNNNVIWYNDNRPNHRDRNNGYYYNNHSNYNNRPDYNRQSDYNRQNNYSGRDNKSSNRTNTNRENGRYSNNNSNYIKVSEPTNNSRDSRTNNVRSGNTERSGSNGNGRGR